MATLATKIAASILIGIMVTSTSFSQEITVLAASSGAKPMVLDITATQAMPQTSTIWTDGVQSYVGVALSDFQETTNATAETIRIVALNDYAIEVPVSDAVSDGPIITYHLNGELMSVGNKGPFWLVYPFDAKAEYRSETIYSRSLWQVNRMAVHD